MDWLGGAHADTHRRTVRRVAGLGLTALVAAVIAAPALEAAPMHSNAVVLVLVAALAAHLLALQLLTSRQGVSPPPLVVAAACAVVTSVLWIEPRLAVPGFPERDGSAMTAALLGAVAAAVFGALFTWEVGTALLLGLWAAALDTFLLFAGSLLAFSLDAASVPDTQGRVMLPSATAAERLTQNRIEAPDGYLGLLALTLLLALLLCAGLAERSRHVSHQVRVAHQVRAAVEVHHLAGQPAGASGEQDRLGDLGGGA